MSASSPEEISDEKIAEVERLAKQNLAKQNRMFAIRLIIALAGLAIIDVVLLNAFEVAFGPVIAPAVTTFFVLAVLAGFLVVGGWDLIRKGKVGK